MISYLPIGKQFNIWNTVTGLDIVSQSQAETKIIISVLRQVDIPMSELCFTQIFQDMTWNLKDVMQYDEALQIPETVSLDSVKKKIIEDAWQ